MGGLARSRGRGAAASTPPARCAAPPARAPPRRPRRSRRRRRPRGSGRAPGRCRAPPPRPPRAAGTPPGPAAGRAPAARRRRSARGWRPSRDEAGPRRRGSAPGSRRSRAAPPAPARARGPRSPSPPSPSRTASASAPASSSAPEQHVARDARDAVHVQRPHHAAHRLERRVRGAIRHVVDTRHRSAPVTPRLPAERAIRAAIVPAPNPSSMPTTARPAAHEESMDEQGGDAAERRPVAHAGRHADHRRGHEAADDGGERGVLAGDDHDAVRPLEVAQRRRQAVQAGHAGVRVHDDLRAEQLGAHARLGDHRAVRGAAGDDGHQPADRRHRHGRPRPAAPARRRTRPGRRAAAPPGRPRRRA